MVEETDYFLSQDGLRLYYHQWTEDDPKAILCIIHGLGEHSKRYAHLAHELVKHGIAVFAMDLRGHGLSEGRKGHSKRYDLLLSDVEELLKTARSNYTELPMFLMGHSMGGNLVANYMISMNTNELEGFILSAPWFRLAFTPPAWKLKLGNFLARTIPAFTQPNGLEAVHLSKDQQVVEDYLNDPLVHDRISAGLFEQIRLAGEVALQKAESIDEKVLVYHGDMDHVIDWKASEAFAKSCKNGEWKQLKGVYHEPINDLEKADVINMLVKWIKR